MDAFVYGTLTDPHQTAAVLADYTYGPWATLDGLHQVAGEYPTLAPGGETEGQILRTDDVAALDDYEGVDRGLYVRVGIPSTDDDWGSEDGIQVYVGDPEQLGVGDEVEWPGSGSFEERVRAYVRENDVRVRIE